MPLDDCREQLASLVALARNCRNAQRLYYRDRDQASLIAAKRWEADLDRRLTDLEEALLDDSR